PEARTPRYVQRAIRKAGRDTSGNTGMVLTVAFDYGSRAEIVHAARAAAAAGVVDQQSLSEHLYLPDLPDVDVVVRTSGEHRISNFMLWQSEGAKVYFSDLTWPDFDGPALDAAIALVRR
ncbi:MAG: undecaprenyl diphosphate synthase family protein, partial [Ilumatobacteraceae bacterium]